jgi:hypothetical protein
MIKITLLVILSAAITGCTFNIKNLEGPPAALRIEGATTKVLLGDYKYLLVTVKENSVIAEAELNVSDGTLSCMGKVNYNEKTEKSISMPLKCTDGRTGSLIVTFSRATWRADQGALGVGNLNDGAKLRLILGNMTGTINW